MEQKSIQPIDIQLNNTIDLLTICVRSPPKGAIEILAAETPPTTNHLSSHQLYEIKLLHLLDTALFILSLFFLLNCSDTELIT